MKMINLKISFILVALLLLPLVSAFGVTTPYWDENPLVISPGETKEFALVLQNMVSEEDITLKAELVSGAEIAEMTDSIIEYLVPAGRKDINVNLKVMIPEGTALGTEYIIGVSFSQVAMGEEGEMMQMASGVEKTIPVIVGEHVEEETPATEESAEEESSYSGIVTLLIIVVVVIILYAVFKPKKKKK